MKSINNKNKKIAIFTICNNSFVPGLKVLLHSFWKHNLNFNGDVVVGYSDTISPLSEKNKGYIIKLFRNKLNIIFENINSDPYEKIIKHVPLQSSRFTPALLLFHIFSLNAYRKILYIDSDILICSSLSKIFNQEEDFIVFRDVYKDDEKTGTVGKEDRRAFSWKKKIKGNYVQTKRYLINKFYNKPIFLFITKSTFFVLGKIFHVHPAEHDYDFYFNTGFICVGEKYLSQEWHQRIMDFAKTQRLAFFPDQDILNNFARENFDKIYYLDGCKNGIKVRYENKNFNNFKKDKPYFVHYVGKKPWQQEQEKDTENLLFNFSLVGGRKIKIFYRVDESYSMIDSLWHKSYTELENINNDEI